MPPWAARYGIPTRNEPQWYVGYAVFQNGNPRLKRQSLTGSGVIPLHNAPSGTFKPIVHGYTGRTVSAVGPGVIAARPPFLTRLFANPSGNNRNGG